jgi:hypothetical protein
MPPAPRDYLADHFDDAQAGGLAEILERGRSVIDELGDLLPGRHRNVNDADSLPPTSLIQPDG